MLCVFTHSCACCQSNLQAHCCLTNIFSALRSLFWLFRVPADGGMSKVNNFLTPLGFAIQLRSPEGARALLQEGDVDFDSVCEMRNLDTALKFTITSMIGQSSGIFHAVAHLGSSGRLIPVAGAVL